VGGREREGGVEEAVVDDAGPADRERERERERERDCWV
jgi:hypothetical protein